jgi:pteridine reductase
LDASPLIGKAALVTGAARRVGRAVALELARAGLDIAFTYRSSSQEVLDLVREVEALGRRALAVRADLEDAGAPDAIFDEVSRAFPKLYALVNNASFFEATPLAKLTLQDFERNLAVNARAPLFLMQRFAPLLASHERPGRIVSFVDIHVLGQPLKGYVAYNVSKAALLEATMTLAMELAPRVTVNAVAPGVVEWPESYSAKEKESYLKRVPLGRPGTPGDAARAVLFLVRDADYTTGQVLRLDGGRLLT